MSMVQHWTKLKERKRVYYFPDNSKITVEKPSAIYISNEGTHYISYNEDTQRLIIKNTFLCICIDVENAQDWVHPKPIIKYDTWPLAPVVKPTPPSPSTTATQETLDNAIQELKDHLAWQKEQEKGWPKHPISWPSYPPYGTLYKVTCDSVTHNIDDCAENVRKTYYAPTEPEKEAKPSPSAWPYREDYFRHFSNTPLGKK